MEIPRTCMYNRKTCRPSPRSTMTTVEFVPLRSPARCVFQTICAFAVSLSAMLFLNNLENDRKKNGQNSIKNNKKGDYLSSPICLSSFSIPHSRRRESSSPPLFYYLFGLGIVFFSFLRCLRVGWCLCAAPVATCRGVYTFCINFVASLPDG